MKFKRLNRISVFALSICVSVMAAPTVHLLAPSGPVPVEAAPAPELSSDEIYNMLADALKAPSAQSHEDAISFFQKHAPKRFEVYNALPDGGRLKSKILDQWIKRFDQLEHRRTADPDIYAILVKQIELQDDASALIRADQQPADNKELRQKVGELVDLSLQERQSRIDHLEKTLQDLKAKLNEDKGNRDALIDQHLEQMKQDASKYAEGIRGLRTARQQQRLQPQPQQPGR